MSEGHTRVEVRILIRGREIRTATAVRLVSVDYQPPENLVEDQAALLAELVVQGLEQAARLQARQARAAGEDQDV